MTDLAGKITSIAAPRGPNCGVVAIALMTGEPFEKVFHLIQMNCHRNWKGSTFREDRDRALTLLGFDIHRTQYKDPELTLWQFISYVAKPNVRYLLTVRGHAFVAQDGKVFDNMGTYLIENYLYRDHWLRDVVTITKKSKVESPMLDMFKRGAT